MYHEEKVIDGKLCWRGLPNSEWVEYTQEQLTRLITEAQSKQYSRHENAPWWANPDMPPMKVTC